MERPSADAFLEAFDGRFYVPVSEPIAGWMPFGWGAYDGEPESLGLALTLGPRKHRCVMRTGVRPDSARTVATVSVRGLSVTVQIRTSLLPGLELGLIEPEQLREMLQTQPG